MNDKRKVGANLVLLQLETSHTSDVASGLQLKYEKDSFCLCFTALSVVRPFLKYKERCVRML